MRKKKRSPHQTNMFDDTCADMPLFSGTPQTVRAMPFIERPQTRQLPLIPKPTWAELAEANRKKQ